MSTHNVVFGCGDLILSNSDGYETRIAELKDISLSLDLDIATFKGSNIWDEDASIKGAKLTGKASSAKVNGALLNAMLTGTTTAGITASATEAHTIAATAVTATNSATWASDLGVWDALGNQMTAVAATPAIGQYTVAAGVYGFHASEAGTVTIAYTYTHDHGHTYTFNNTATGAAPLFVAHLHKGHRTAHVSLKLNAVVVPKLSMSLKADDYAESDLEFQAIADSSGVVFTFGQD